MRPAELGYTMPAEWASHAGCWMAWPTRAELWRERIEGAREDDVRVARTIAAHEPVTVWTFDQGRVSADRRLMAAGLRAHFRREWSRDEGSRCLYVQRMGWQVPPA